MAKMTQQTAHHRIMGQPISLFVFNPPFQPYGLLAQWVSANSDPLVILEWIFLPHNFGKTVTTTIEMIAMVIQKGSDRLLALEGTEPDVIYLPLDMKQIEFLFHHSVAFQCAFMDFPGQISVHFPTHKLLQSVGSLYLLPVSQFALTQIMNALTVSRDGSGQTGHVVIVWRDHNSVWNSNIHTTTSSPQIVELSAVVCAFQRRSEPLRIVTDSFMLQG